MTEVFSQGPCGVLKNQNNSDTTDRIEMIEGSGLILIYDMAVDFEANGRQF